MIKLVRKEERTHQNKNFLLEKIWPLNSSFWSHGGGRVCAHPSHYSGSTLPAPFVSPLIQPAGLCIFNTNSIFMPVNKQVLAAHLGAGCLMHMQCLPEDESFDEYLANKYSSHWNTICEFFSSFMKNWKRLERNKWAISHDSSLLPLLSCFALLCMVENLLKNALYYWPSTFWKWFCHPSSP